MNNFEQNVAEDSRSNLMQGSTDTGILAEDQNVLPQTNTQNPASVNPWRDVAQGIQNYIIAFFFSIFSPIFVALTSIIFILATPGSDPDFLYVWSGAFGIPFGLSFGLVSFLILSATYSFCQTPKEIFPHAKMWLLFSLGLTIIFIALNYCELLCPDYLSSLIPNSFDKAFELITFGMMFCSYFIFYLFLSVIGKKTIGKSCKGAIFFLTASYILLALVIILSNPAPLDDVEYVSSISDLYKGDNITLLISSWVSYIIGAILLFKHIFRLEDYFTINNLYKKEDKMPLGALCIPIIIISIILNWYLFYNIFHSFIEIQ